MAQVAVLGMYPRAMMLPIAYITLAKGHSKAYLAIEGLSAVVLVLATAACFDRWGLTGAGAAILIGNAFDLAVIIVYAGLRYRYRMSRQVLAYAALQLPLGAAAYAATFAGTTAARIALGLAAFAASLTVSAYALQKKTGIIDSLKQRFGKRQ